MTKSAIAAAALPAMLLAACATTPALSEPGPLSDETASCDAAKAQRLMGQRATAETGAELLRLTGARTLRWVPPRTAVTMDFRADRLTVSYDDNLIIERISCG